MEKYQKEFKLVNPAYTSRTCPRCGYIKKKCPFHRGLSSMKVVDTSQTAI
ncbi:zinc ribbon domain-containing protein [Candidatus Acidianus copahuensis]